MKAKFVSEVSFLHPCCNAYAYSCRFPLSGVVEDIASQPQVRAQSRSSSLMSHRGINGEDVYEKPM